VDLLPKYRGLVRNVIDCSWIDVETGQRFEIAASSDQSTMAIEYQNVPPKSPEQAEALGQQCTAITRFDIGRLRRLDSD
jgi:hypothetical protein